ncbi:NitT/TauT family transport system substrate-binding protein [Parabacteroides sp. PFB2-10]|uniref:ABC transporter substrate-binding protein n=1 Tax=Parabacteroides sp. PFB2-10 TaxID=1742405 RepID=UPI002474E266|nr:ABC transporter substrate-binding protein [Parabacteroides sp. PFB2-10]MDH6312087.1 NitT/TauT family transport system substrate-binding protein [Parabacteroides sp. PFB2-10]
MKRQMIYPGILLFIVLLLTGCGGKKQESSLRVTILRGPSAIAFAGWIEQPPVIDGRKVVVEVADSPQQVQALLIRRETDLAVVPMISAANLYNKGIDYQLAGCPIWGNLYLVGLPDARQLHLFGSGTTPDILARYYLEKQALPYRLNYTLTTASEVTLALLAGKAEAAVLAEPFVSYVLREKPELKLLADLNNPSGDSPGFAETAVLFRSSLQEKRSVIDSLLAATCHYARQKPTAAIAILEKEGIFPPGLLTEESIERCRIDYLPIAAIREETEAFLRIIYQYEPKALGNKLPDNSFYQ